MQTSNFEYDNDGPYVTINFPIENVRRWLDQEAVKGRVFRPLRFGTYPLSSCYSAWACGCPLATYAREVLGYKDAAWVSNCLIADCRRETKTVTNMWTAEFVKRVDEEYSGAEGISALKCSAIIYDLREW